MKYAESLLCMSPLFQIGGVDHGVAFSELPSGPLYPAVSLGLDAKVTFYGYRYLTGHD